MASEKKELMQAYEPASGDRGNWSQDKKVSMEECRAVYMAEGSKGAAIWSGITAAGTWWSMKKRSFLVSLWRPGGVIFAA
jgi:hypothetical protein